jgi:transglutaminase-like putative cysteine protease
VSRRSFRAQVADPRPASAWLLVTVASATLWITQQLDPEAVAVQVAAIIGSLWRRERPFFWQSSPIALNLGMFGIVAATITVALRGDPSTIALAHFAALTQGLQLIDTRPRHTELLLVALALFQVVLAANLTDSVFFPPLLVAFVFATVWTLMVHTLRTEAIEAGDPGGVTRAITPGLLRATLVASGLSVLLALALFVTLPRLRTSVFTGSSIAPQLATAGFSERVALGELGRIRLDPTVVMRVETLDGTAPPLRAAYWRGLAFDRFDGRAWSITPSGRDLVAGSPEGGVSLGRGPEHIDLVQRIVREPVEAGVLFTLGEVRRLQGTVRRLERDASAGLYAVGQANERVRYVVESLQRRWNDPLLRRDVAAPAHRRTQRDLQLPELSPAVAELAHRIVEGQASDADRVRALEHYLIANGRYSNIPPRIDDESERSPVEAFLLGEMAGHCEYFASAMVMLARSLDIPARLVNGFAGGKENSIGGFIEVTRSDAHTWVEVHYARSGWVRYDPTPPDLRARPAVALSFSERMRELASTVELWWFQRVVGFDRADQIRALKRAWLAWRGAREPRTASAARRGPGSGTAAYLGGTLPEMPPWLGATLVALLLVAWRRHRLGQRSPVPAAYREALRLLRRRGLVRAPQTTAREFARRVRAEQPDTVAVPFAALTEAYLVARFGGRPPRRCAGELLALRTGLRGRTRGFRLPRRTRLTARPPPCGSGGSGAPAADAGRGEPAAPGDAPPRATP